MSAPGPVVLHSTPLWLPPTSPWLWNQVRFVPPPVVTHVVAEEVRNLDRFPIAPLHRFDREPPVSRWVDRALRRSGLRAHLGFVERVAREVRADVVHSHWGDAGWRDVVAVRRAGALHVVSFYGKDVQFLPKQDPRWSERYRTMFGTVSRVLCEGPHFASTLRRMGCPEDKLRVQPLGVDTRAIRFARRARRVGEPLKILVASSFREKKGIPDAIDAAGAVAREMGGVTLTIVGDASDDPRSLVEKERVAAAVERQRDVLPIRMLGYATHEELLGEAYGHDVFVAASRHASDGDSEGGAPVVLLDMAATGMPVVATRHCDIPGVVPEGRAGLLADEGDITGLAAALRRIASEPDLGPGLGEGARRHVESAHDVRVLGAALGRIYAEIAAR